jgi:hypothetical protein
MMENDLKKLNIVTHRFIDLHWPQGDDMPRWSAPWDFISGIPQGDCPGCYAFFDFNGNIIYIGVGASKGSGLYKGFGLAHRLNRYKKKVYGENTNYVLIEPWREIVKDVITIGFPDELYYLAYAFEAFLIMNLEPDRNVIGRR